MKRITTFTLDKKAVGNDGNTVTLLIPCIKTHAKFLPRLIYSVRDQSRPHDEVIIAISEFGPQETKKLQKQLDNIFPVKIYSTPQKQAKAQNINRIAKVAKGNLIDIFDADDMMHPQRLEILIDAKQKLSVEAVLHSSNKKKTSTLYDKKYSQYEVLNAKEVFLSFQRNDKNSDEKIELIPGGDTTRWWPNEICCVSPILIDKDPFIRKNLYLDEIPGVLNINTPGEDIVFIRQLINSCQNKSKCVGYVKTPLMKYFPSSSRKEKHWRYN